MIETPDYWVFVECTSPTYGQCYKVLGGWAYMGRYRLSSGVLSVQDLGFHYKCPQHSGMIYLLHKDFERMQPYMHDALDRFKAKLVHSDGDINIVSSKEVFKEYGF